MDKFDLDFIRDSQEPDLLYKHVLKAICGTSDKIRDGVNRYTIDQVIIHNLSTSIIYSSKYRTIHIGRIDKYAMEL